MLHCNREFRWWVFLVLATCLIPIAGNGQGTGGTISGSVMDQTAATIPGAMVAVRNLETNIVRSTITVENGRFNFPALPVGQYELTVELQGFSKYVRGPITLVLNQEAVVNVEIRPAGVQDSVVVTDDVPILNTTTAEVGVQFDEKRLAELPISGQFASGGGFRDVFAVALSAPGVSQINNGNTSFANGTPFSSNGMRQRGNNYTIDGQDSNDPSVSGRSQFMNNPDVVKEVRLITNQFAAEYGRSAGSIVNAITKSGSNSFHGSAFEFYNGNHLNSMSNLDKAAGNKAAPFLIEHQFGGTVGGPILKDKTFFFGSLQRWTIRQLGSGTTITGVPTDQGKQLIQQLAGTQPQVAALLKFLPAAQTPIAQTAPLKVGDQTVSVPLGKLTGSAPQSRNNWQWSGRVDHQLTQNHSLGGRYLYNDNVDKGVGAQVTPPGLTTVNPVRTQAATAWLTSTLSSRALNEVRVSYQRYASTTTAANPESETIPSVEVPELGLTGFNNAQSRTAIGLAINLPQYRTNNTYQLQDTMSYTRGSHAYKFGMDLRKVGVKSFFLPQIRGRLVYDTLQKLVDDVASVANINKPLPGGQVVAYYDWNDYYFFAQDQWRVAPSFTLDYGLRYELPGNSFQSLYDLNDRILANNNNQPVFRLSNRPGRDTNNFQPRFGFSWNPRTGSDGALGWLTGKDALVVRGGYARANDYGFININLNIFSSFPFVLATNSTNLSNAWTQMPKLLPDLSNPTNLNLLTRTVVANDFRSPIAEQFALELQRGIGVASVFRVGYVGTKGTGLFQTLDGNPRTQCSPIPTNSSGAATGCPRLDPTAGVIRLRANAASSIYHSMQASFDRRFTKGFSAGAHYTWSAFIDDASEIFNPSVSGEIAVSQDFFNRHADRARSTYDRPQRFALNFVYQLPNAGRQPLVSHILSGWQVSSFLTLQSGSPFTPLNGSDPDAVLGGIDGVVGSAIRPNLNTNLDVSKMSIEQLIQAGGRSLFSTLPPCVVVQDTNTCIPGQRTGNVGRNILRSDGIGQIDVSLSKATKITETQQLQLRADFFNFTNTRNFGIPEARVSNAGFANQWGTDGGNRRIFVSLKYLF
ncbi:MAG TPA: carboxypeptidase regulatory-like domain-containing protein [Terriglobia bacterium]|nr:carboxypeptidase regulatory-like domain-containing protein [Terriglobia bacterium]